VNQAGQKAREHADAGEEAAETAIGRLEDVQALADTVTTTMEDLTTQADEMDEIVDIIQSIADQTNMLALNSPPTSANRSQRSNER